MKIKRKYLWHRDLPDHRDKTYHAPPPLMMDIPPRVNLIGGMPEVYDQGSLGSCTANALAAAVQFEMKKSGHRERWNPSRLFIYYAEREIEGTINEDSGAQLRDGIKALASLGVCDEQAWEYDVSRFTTRPPKACYVHAEKHQVIQYRRIPQDIDVMKACLASGYPFSFGFSVFKSFTTPEVASTGMMSMPRRIDSMLGGHAVIACGFDSPTRRILVRNSYGSKWGIEGYFWMPEDYIINPGLAADFWTITMTEK